jgi:hypothetical protein
MFGIGKRKCIFCGGSSLSAEHIYPKWLFSVIEIEEVSFNPSTNMLVIESTDTIDQLINVKNNSDGRRILYENFTIKQVCKNCNSGWMSSLETEVKPVIQRLKVRDFENDLNADEAFVLSRWAIMKIILIGLAIQEKTELDPFYLELLKEGVIPEGFIVEYRKMGFNFINYAIGNNAPLAPENLSKQEMDLISGNLFVGGLHIGRAGIRISLFRSLLQVHRIQVNDPLDILFPYKSKLPNISVEVDVSVPAPTGDEEVMALCNGLTLCDRIY